MDTLVKMEGHWYGFKLTKTVDNRLIYARRCFRFSTAVKIMNEMLRS